MRACPAHCRGTTRKLPLRALDLSPFTRAPEVPAVQLSVTAILALAAAAVAWFAAGLVPFRRRNLARPA